MSRLTACRRVSPKAGGLAAFGRETEKRPLTRMYVSLKNWMSFSSSGDRDGASGTWSNSHRRDRSSWRSSGETEVTSVGDGADPWRGPERLVPNGVRMARNWSMLTVFPEVKTERSEVPMSRSTSPPKFGSASW